MKFNDVQTLELLLKQLNEYAGMPGPATYSGGTSAIGKAWSATKAAVDRGQQAGKAIGGKKHSSLIQRGSPNTTQKGSPNTTGLEPKEPAVVSVPARELDDGSVFKDEKGREVGTVVARLGKKPKFDKVVVQNTKGEYELYNPDVEVMVDEDISHDILKKITKKQATKKNSIARKIKRLSRQHLGEEELFEINFNKKELVTQALDTPVRCGFEAETSWPDLFGGVNEDVDNLGWYEVEDQLYISSRDRDYIMESFSDYIRENLIDSYYDDIMNEKIEDARDEDSWYKRFMDESNQAPSQDAVDQYKENFKDEDSVEFKNREEDGWEDINWLREYIDEEYEGDFLDFLREVLDEDGDVHQEAYEAAEEDTSIDEWISNEHYSMTAFLDDFGIDYSELQGGDLQEIADSLDKWAQENSLFTDGVETGDYGSTVTDTWAVETDSSIESSGVGAEIISPVYNSPRLMLDELASMFKWMTAENCETNHSTGLHVTMSWTGEKEVKGNKLKMAALLGDKYLLQTFGRERNSYAKQQSKNIKRAATNLLKKDSKGKEGLKKIEDTLTKSISGDKFSSINFKSEKDDTSKNNLIEFRIGGGDDYHTDMAKIVKAVIRYATIMTAGHTDEYDDEYIKSLYRIVHTAGQIDKKDLDLAKDRYDLDNVKEPVVDLFKSMLSKENYFDGLGKIVNAYSQKAEYDILSQPGADEEWRNQVADFEEKTGKNFRTTPGSGKFSEAIPEGPPIKAYLTPPAGSPSERAPGVLNNAQDKYLNALGTLAIDVATEKNRMPINAKSVGLIRKSIKDFELSNEELSERIIWTVGDLNIPTQNDRTSQKVVIIKKGIDGLFRKDVLKAPNFLTSPQCERIVKGVWNAIHTNTWSRKENDELIELLIKLNYGPDVDMDTDGPHNMKQSIINNLNNREFNGFYNRMISSGYNSSSPPAQPGEIYYPDMLKKLIAFTSKYEEYNEPVSPSYNSNIFHDDSYIENYLNSYTMRLRKRFNYMSEIKESDPALWVESIPELGDITRALVQAVVPVTNGVLGELYPNLKGTDLEYEKDGNHFLALDEYPLAKINDILDRIVRKEYTTAFDKDVVYMLGDRLTDAIRTMLGQYYKKKGYEPKVFNFSPMSELIKERFAGIKDWMTGFDKIAQKIGFDSQADEIAGKQNIEAREKQFKKDVQKRPPAKINIPDGSKGFIRRDIYEKITDDELPPQGRLAYQQAYKHNFGKNLNQEGVYVIPASHWKQAEEAYEIKDSLDSLEDTPLGQSQQWRLPIANEIEKRFLLKYKTSWNTLLSDVYILISYKERDILLRSGVEATNLESSEDGPPLVPWEETKNPDDDTDFDRQQAAAKGVYNRVDHEIWLSAELEGNEEASSGNLFDKTNWEKVANILDVEFAMGGGPVLLKTTVNTSLQDHTKYKNSNGSPEVGMKRWLLAVKDAVKHIKKNYQVVDGTYTKKLEEPAWPNANQPLGSVTSTGDVVDYAKARSEYELFDRIYSNGLDAYVPLEDAPRLVGFLNNMNNDEELKLATLKAIANNFEAGLDQIPLQMALAQARHERNHELAQSESVFYKFDKLNLQEQIRKLESIGTNKINNIHSKMFEGALLQKDFYKSDRIRAFANKLRTGADFDLLKYTGTIKLDPTMADQFDNAVDPVAELNRTDPKAVKALLKNVLPSELTTADGGIIKYNELEKTTEFGGRGGAETVSNKGEVAEGILGCATFARLLIRPSAPLTTMDIQNVIKQLPTDAPDKGGWHELTLTAQEIDHPIADFFTLTINLKSDTYKSFITPEKWPVMDKISRSVVLYVNDNLRRYTDYFQANGKVDSVHVIADGVSGETDTKVDVFLTHSFDGGPERTLKHFDMSVKTGTTSQIGQIGGGRQTDPLSIRFAILAEMWNKFSVDLTNIEDQFVNAGSIEEGYVIAYEEATKQLNSHLTSKEKEKGFLVKLLDSIKFFATLNDDRVKLVQFADTKAGGYYVLDFKKLDKMFDKNIVDLEATYIEKATWPKVVIFNKITKKPFLTVRMKPEHTGYIRNYIEKGKGLVELIKVRDSSMRKKVESVQESDSEMYAPSHKGYPDAKSTLPYNFFNEFDVLSYIIGKDHVQKIFRQSLEPKRDTIGSKWLKLRLQKENHLFEVPGTWREYILYLNDKLQPNNPDVGSSLQYMLTFAKVVAENINQVSSIATQWQDAKSDLQGIKDLNDPEKYKEALKTARKSAKIANEEMNNAQSMVIGALQPLIRKIEYFYQAMKVESIREGAVPNNDTVRKLRELFAVPLMSNDIKGQMNAYFCIPEPSMIRDFRAARSSFGDNFDLRSILKSYAKLKLHDTIQKQVAY